VIRHKPAWRGRNPTTTRIESPGCGKTIAHIPVQRRAREMLGCRRQAGDIGVAANAKQAERLKIEICRDVAGVVDPFLRETELRGGARKWAYGEY